MFSVKIFDLDPEDGHSNTVGELYAFFGKLLEDKPELADVPVYVHDDDHNEPRCLHLAIELDIENAGKPVGDSLQGWQTKWIDRHCLLLI